MNLRKFVYFPLLFIFAVFSLLQADELTPLVEIVEKIAIEHRLDPSTPVPIVAIGGCPGVGKTYFTNELLARLEEKGWHVAILPIDHFNLSPEERRRIGTEWDPRHLQSGKLHQVLAAIAEGQRQVIKPFCYQLTAAAGEEVLDLREVDLLLFEGLYALCTQEPLHFFSYCAIGIYLEADEADISSWKWQREMKKASPRSPEQFVKHMEDIFSDFHQNVSPSKENATFILYKNSEHQYKLALQHKKT